MCTVIFSTFLHTGMKKAFTAELCFREMFSLYTLCIKTHQATTNGALMKISPHSDRPS